MMLRCMASWTASCNSRTNACFYAHKYHYEHTMCHLFDKDALTFVKAIILHY
jgi:hypothetical protein